MERYNPQEIEAKWQKIWEQNKVFKATEHSGKPKYYVLEMLPYPSGNIHVGHTKNYVLGDVLARYKRAKGFEVLHPMGWDGFGLPAENAAFERGVHPGKWTYENITTMREQIKRIGSSLDWDRELATCDPDYYAQQQRIFIEAWRENLVYRKDAWVNWDPVDHTVLANEQVIDGRGWRSGAPVERRKLNQWFFKITDFAEDLLQSLEDLDRWPERVRTMQANWIGRSQGALIHFQIKGRKTPLEVYTTRPDTIFGASFCALAPHHPLTTELARDNPKLQDFIAVCDQLGTSEEAVEKAVKIGYDTGLEVIHPFDPERKFPLYVTNFVLAEYGTGAIFGCPAHDQRDLEFARKYDLPVIPVVLPSNADEKSFEIKDTAFIDGGQMINSGFLNGLTPDAAKQAAIDRLEAEGKGIGKIQYRLRDWGVSRQRYWGCPIPMVHCPNCGIVAVPIEKLPVALPEDVDFDQPGNPLEHHPTWSQTDCPQCKGPARRDTDTMDTFVDSSWYFARYCSPKAGLPLEREAVDFWMPVDQYIGGIEHAVLHLLYSRFFTRLLKQLGYISVKEPFAGLFTQGMIGHRTYKDSKGRWLYPHEVIEGENATFVTTEGEPVSVGRVEKMSKSKRNVVTPDHIADLYGADALRWFVLSDSPPERDMEWTESGIEGSWRFTQRIWRLINSYLEAAPNALPKPDTFSPKAHKLRKGVHQSIDAVSQDIERLHMNKAVARLYDLSNRLQDFTADSADEIWTLREGYETLIRLSAPMMPHLGEELWSKMGYGDLLATHPWPQADPDLVSEETVTIAIQVNGKLRGTIEQEKDAPKDKISDAALADASVRKFLGDKEPRKIIVVPNRIVNIVI